MTDIKRQDNDTVTLTSREFFRNPARITEMTRRGQRITVTNRGQYQFEVIGKVNKPLTGASIQEMFGDLMITKTGETDLSQRIDEIVYGT